MTAIDPASVHPPRSGRERLLLWSGLLGPILLWLMHLEINYLVVPYACRKDAILIVHAVTVAFILAVAGLGLLGLTSWRRAGREWPDSSASVVSQDRFLATIGLLLSAITIMALVAQWLPTFFVDPCR
jgi:cytochrome c biogenesis factor